jgi:hypothetical protein
VERWETLENHRFTLLAFVTSAGIQREALGVVGKKMECMMQQSSEWRQTLKAIESTLMPAYPAYQGFFLDPQAAAGSSTSTHADNPHVISSARNDRQALEGQVAKLGGFIEASKLLNLASRSSATLNLANDGLELVGGLHPQDAGPSRIQKTPTPPVLNPTAPHSLPACLGLAEDHEEPLNPAEQSELSRLLSEFGPIICNSLAQNDKMDCIDPRLLLAPALTSEHNQAAPEALSSRLQPPPPPKPQSISSSSPTPPPPQQPRNFVPTRERVSSSPLISSKSSTPPLSCDNDSSEDNIYVREKSVESTASLSNATGVDQQENAEEIGPSNKGLDYQEGMDVQNSGDEVDQDMEIDGGNESEVSSMGSNEESGKSSEDIPLPKKSCGSFR